jgi:hypothetical protein
MLNGVVIDDTRLFNDRLQEWETFYNSTGPRGAWGQTPYGDSGSRRRARCERVPSAAHVARVRGDRRPLVPRADGRTRRHALLIEFQVV